ncbi:recombinase family protein [Burkholderia stagnalis]
MRLRPSRRGAQFASLTESINTNSSGGVLVFHMMAALAQFERSLISERTRAGLAAARERGKKLGRRCALTETQQQQALQLLKGKTITEVAETFKVHPRTLTRMLNNRSSESGSLQSRDLHHEQMPQAQ